MKYPLRSKVRVMAVADVHGDFEKLDVSSCEVVIVAGDIGPGQPNDGRESEAWAESRHLIDWFRRHSNVRFYILPGNHDLFARHREWRERLDGLWPENVKLINDKGFVDESGLTIWGMPWNPIHYKAEGVPTHTKGGAFAADDAKIVRKCEKIVRRFKALDILVVHAPPRVKGTSYGVDNWHLSPALASMLPRINPHVLICGHLHDLSHVPEVINNGRTLAVNVSIKDHSGRHLYRPRIIEVEVTRTVDVAIDMKDDMRVRPLPREDVRWLKAISLRIEKTVRGVDKLIAEGKSGETANRDTAKKFNAEVVPALPRLQKLAPLDDSGRVKKLVEVVRLLQASEKKGWSEQVLPELCQPNAPCHCYPGRKWNIDFRDYRYE